MFKIKKLFLLVAVSLFSISAIGQNYPTCSSASSDPDGDGWGWENNESCQVAAGGSSTSITSSSSGGQQCDWYGSPYPLCANQSSGWGYENNQSCIGSSTCSEAGGVTSTTSANTNNSSNNSGGNGGYAICRDSSSDPDGDGWGWENNESCQVGSGSASGGSVSNTNTANNNNGGDGSSVGTCPSSLSCPSGMSCGCYIVSGLGANKRAYQDAGADRNFLASAMMETERMDTNYAYGDNKTGDAFNAGATKQNWGMMRQCHSAWTGYGSGDYAVSDEMNSSRSLDVQVYNECRSYFGNNWFAGHRNGSSGLSNPNTQDIQNFRAAWDWTYNNLAGHESDDIRFWVDVPAI